MEDKIEVREYVRLNYGKIDRVKNNDYYMQQYIECEKGLYLRENIVKHSKNIIDLIEVGDYVNGDEVITVYGYDNNGNDKDGLGICEVDDDYAYYTYLEDIDIKSIVTKEQFKQVQYEVGD